VHIHYGHDDGLDEAKDMFRSKNFTQRNVFHVQVRLRRTECHLNHSWRRMFDWKSQRSYEPTGVFFMQILALRFFTIFVVETKSLTVTDHEILANFYIVNALMKKTHFVVLSDGGRFDSLAVPSSCESTRPFTDTPSNVMWWGSSVLWRPLQEPNAGPASRLEPRDRVC